MTNGEKIRTDGDTISRQAAIDLIERMKPYHQTADDIAEMIHNMPSAQPEPQWIPCSERLPDVRYDALGNWWSDEVILLMNDEEYVQVCNGHFNPIGMFEVEEEDGPAAVGEPVKDVIAWMPLPDPHREDGEE